MEPAYHIPLADNELKMIGEICAIQGQIDHLMQRITTRLLKLSAPAVCAILGSAGIKTNSDIWIQIFRDKVTDKDALALAEDTFAKIHTLAEGRNDFVHAFFAEGHGDDDRSYYLTGGPEKPTPKNPIAIRTRNQKQRSAKEIKTIRDSAALISVQMSQLDRFSIFGQFSLPSKHSK